MATAPNDILIQSRLIELEWLCDASWQAFERHRCSTHARQLERSGPAITQRGVSPPAIFTTKITFG